MGISQATILLRESSPNLVLFCGNRSGGIGEIWPMRGFHGCSHAKRSGPTIAYHLDTEASPWGSNLTTEMDYEIDPYSGTNYLRRDFRSHRYLQCLCHLNSLTARLKVVSSASI